MAGLYAAAVPDAETWMSAFWLTQGRGIGVHNRNLAEDGAGFLAGRLR